jgi:ketosteroid isomerase-like protein
MWRDMVLTPVEFIDAGEDAVVVVATLRGHGHESDAPTETTVAFAYEVRNGLAVRDRAFTSRSQALEAAGLSE